MSNDNPPQVLFVTMPWATPVHPSLALGLLKAILDQADISSECLYGNLLLPVAKGGIYTLEDPGHYDDRSAGLSFVPYLYSHIDAEHIAHTLDERYRRLVTREGQLDVESYSFTRGRDEKEVLNELVEQTRSDVNAAGVCLSRCLERIAQNNYDIIGFSLVFETQLIASLALARRIKERWPDKRIVFGGSACVAGQGVALLKTYDWIDAVCLGEGDELIVPLVRALRGDGDLKDVKGVAFRSGADIHVNEKGPPMMDLDWLPTPNYDSFFAQKKESEWTDTLTMVLFETSRGCWWGEKHLCSFCGLNAETLTYRSKSAERVIDEISEIDSRWEIGNGLQAVDNIFDMRYFKELVPLLIEFQKKRTKGLGIFFEIKSNLKYRHLVQLAAAGVASLQPGIESFNDHILKLMDKGSNAVQQVNFIKWANQVGISTFYNILMRNPGETAQDYLQMVDLLPYIRHIQPPSGIANMQLERYSPYFLKPAEYGIRNIRPQPHYKDMFPDPSIETDQIIYQFDFEHDELDAPDLVAARKAFTLGIMEWKSTYKPHQLDYYLSGEDVLIVDRRDGDEHLEHLRGYAADIFRFLDQGQSFAVIQRNFPDITANALRAFLERMVSMKFVYHHHNDLYVAVPIRIFLSSEEYYAEMNREVEAAMVPPPVRNRRELVVLQTA